MPFANFTRIKCIKNHSGEVATLRCLQTGIGYRIEAGKSLISDVTIPWLYDASNANSANPPFLRIDLASGRYALVFQHGDHVYTGTSFSQSGQASPHSAVNGDRDLVIGKAGLSLFAAGQSPNYVEGKPAASDVLSVSAEGGTEGFARANPASMTEPALPEAPDLSGALLQGDVGDFAPLAPYRDTYDSGQMSAQQYPKGTIICLHGFDPFMTAEPRAKFGQFIASLREHWEPRGYVVFAPAYPSVMPFPQCAEFVTNSLISGGWPIHRTHYVGYSMGGLVARRMIEASVSQPASLTTICTPHHGTAVWVPSNLYTPGAKSLHPTSLDIGWINHMAGVDKAMRSRYLALGVVYQDQGTGGWHQNDQLIEVVSQRGDGLGFGASKTLGFYEKRGIAFGAVHSESQHWPMAGHIVGHVNTHIASADTRDGIA